jgi:putative transposase
VTDTNVFQLRQPGVFAVPLTEVLRNGARTLLAHAVEAEVAGVRHGYLPECEIMTGIGPVAVRCPRVCDRIGEGCPRIRFSSATVGRHNWKGGEHNSPNRLHDRLFSRTAVLQ